MIHLFLTGVSPYAINCRHGRRVSTNDAYIEPSRGRNNLAIFGDSHVDRVLFEKDRAVGVRVLSGSTARDIRAGEVILSAGAVHSPAILMRSGVGPSDHLEDLEIAVTANLPVGEGLQDHPSILMPILLNADAASAEGFRHTNVCVRYSSSMAGAGPNDMMMVSLNRLGDSLAAHVGGDNQGERQVGLIGLWVNQCFSGGALRLASSNPHDHPVVDLNMLDDPSDLERMRDGIRRLQALGHGAALAEIGDADPDFLAQTSDVEIDAMAMLQSGDTQHTTSTCRMGAEGDPLAVVDDECRVFGLQGLRVIDASIMPQVVRANTHLTTVMIAEHMSARLLDA